MFDMLHAPHLLDVEVAQVFRRFALRGTLGEARGLCSLTNAAYRREGEHFLRPWNRRRNTRQE